MPGYNAPVLGDPVLAIYSFTDVKRFQPITYQSEILRTRIDQLQDDFSGDNFVININKFTSDSLITFDILDQDTNTILTTVVDGYLVASADQALVASPTFDFNTIPTLYGKRIRIFNSSEENLGIFDILNVSFVNNNITIGNYLNYISTDNVSVVRLFDGQELSAKATIDYANNQIIIPKASVAASTNDYVFVYYFNLNPVKKTPTRVSCTLIDQVTNNGVLTIAGNSLLKTIDVIFTATSSGLQQSFIAPIRSALGYASTTSIGTNIKLVRVAKLEKVSLISSNSNEVLSVLSTYDIKLGKLKNNEMYSDIFIKDNSLTNFDFTLPTTSNNQNTSINSTNAITVGDSLRATFYVSIENDTESLNFTRNGTLYTNKVFTALNRVYISSGFKSSNSSKFVCSFMTQPAVGSRYKSYYDYTAPKQNERVVVRYNYNKLISDVTQAIEVVRPINADVIARAANALPIDVTMAIVIDADFTSSSALVVQNLQDALITALSTNTLGDVLDASDLVNTAYTVQGVTRSRIVYFNKNGATGQVLSIFAQQDEYFVANNIVITVETR